MALPCTHTHTHSVASRAPLRELTNGRCVTEWEIPQSQTASHLSGSVWESVCLCDWATHTARTGPVI